MSGKERRMTLVLTLGFAGVLAWAVQTKNYVEGFLAIAALSGVASVAIGIWAVQQSKTWLAVVLIPIGCIQCATVTCFARQRS
jgi:hypothetical protein